MPKYQTLQWLADTRFARIQKLERQIKQMKEDDAKRRCPNCESWIINDEDDGVCERIQKITSAEFGCVFFDMRKETA